MNSFDVSNIVSGNGIGISLTGMAIVFSGLLLISLSLWTLPRLLAILEKIGPEVVDDNSVTTVEKIESKNSPSIESVTGETDLAGVIGLVLQLEDQRRQRAIAVPQQIAS